MFLFYICRLHVCDIIDIIELHAWTPHFTFEFDISYQKTKLIGRLTSFFVCFYEILLGIEEQLRVIVPPSSVTISRRVLHGYKPWLFHCVQGNPQSVGTPNYQ